jgi:hypothetical protein
MKLTKKKFLLGYVCVVVVLALFRVLASSIGLWHDGDHAPADDHPRVDDHPQAVAPKQVQSAEKTITASTQPVRIASRANAPHPIRSVTSYDEAFPDTNAVQLVAARQWGVSPVLDRNDAESRKRELVYMASSPYYHVDPLHQSIPYLVPHAAVLLQDIGRAFFDSLYVKGIPLHRFIVTSVLRTQNDVARLRRFNGNATENSCHLYGTTFDICYNRYKTVSDPDGPPRREVRNDTLKYVLSEVLRDMRQQGRCFIKYERKQGCFHMTVR